MIRTQKAEGRRRNAEGRRQKAEGRKQKAVSSCLLPSAFCLPLSGPADTSLTLAEVFSNRAVCLSPQLGGPTREVFCVEAKLHSLFQLRETRFSLWERVLLQTPQL
jgi:hypothetical protein